MKVEVIKEVFNKLVGGIEPVGSTEIDEKKLENLKVQTSLIFDLVLDVKDVALYNKDRIEFSMKETGQHADKFLQNLVDELGEYGYKQNID